MKIRRLAWLFVGLNILDVVTTWVVINQGGVEYSPVLVLFGVTRPWTIALWKLAAVLVIVTGVAVFRKLDWVFVLHWSNIVLGVVVITNLIPLIILIIGG